MNKQQLTDWLFSGITASTVLLYIGTSSPYQPLAASTRAVGYILALLSLGGLAVIMGLRAMRTRGPSERFGWHRLP